MRRIMTDCRAAMLLRAWADDRHARSGIAVRRRRILARRGGKLRGGQRPSAAKRPNFIGLKAMDRASRAKPGAPAQAD